MWRAPLVHPCACDVVLAAACGGGGQAQPATTGTQNGGLHVTAQTVLWGGRTPFVPVRNRAFGVYSGSHLVRMVRTDADGRLISRLPAGRYELRRPDTTVDRVCISPAVVRVSAGRTSRLSVWVTWTPRAAIRAGGPCG